MIDDDRQSQYETGRKTDLKQKAKPAGRRCIVQRLTKRTLHKIEQRLIKVVGNRAANIKREHAQCKPLLQLMNVLDKRFFGGGVVPVRHRGSSLLFTGYRGVLLFCLRRL